MLTWCWMEDEDSQMYILWRVPLLVAPPRTGSRGGVRDRESGGENETTRAFLVVSEAFYFCPLKAFQVALWDWCFVSCTRGDADGTLRDGKWTQIQRMRGIVSNFSLSYLFHSVNGPRGVVRWFYIRCSCGCWPHFSVGMSPNGAAAPRQGKETLCMRSFNNTRQEQQ